MKLDTYTRTVDTDIGKAGSFGIKTENMSHIIDILRNKLYTNKHLAVLREYSINAVDAHIEKDIPLTPIKVTLPTMESPVLSIRDYGNGLDDDEILDTYIMYGSSTKRDSNSQTGGLGLGCKAGFAYGDMFNIINYGENKITHWCAAIDESNLGSIYKTAEQPSDGTSGVEIQVAVDLADRGKFLEEAKKLFAFFDVKPDVNLPEDTSIDLDINMYGPNHDWFLLKQKRDGSYYERQNQGNAIALMGNIPYEIDAAKLPSGFTDANLTECSRLVIRFPVGSLDIAASRESLEYTKKTANSLSIVCQKIKQEIAQTITEQIADQTSLMSASIQAMKLTSSLPHSLQRETFGDTRWKGDTLVNRFQGKTTVHRHFRKHRWRADDYVNTKEEMFAFKVDENTRLITYNGDELSSSQATLRLRTVQQQDDWNKELNYYVIPYTTDKVKLDWVQDQKYDTQSVIPHTNIPINWFKNHKINKFMGTSYHLCSDALDITNLEPMKPKRQVVASDGSVTSYEKIDTCIMRPHRTAAGRIVKSNDIEEFNGEVIYIPLDRYTWHNKSVDLEMETFEKIKNAIKVLCQAKKYTGEPVIHGVKKHYIKKLTDNWIALDEWYLREYNDLLRKHPKMKKILPYTAHWHLNDCELVRNKTHDIMKKVLASRKQFPARQALKSIISADEAHRDDASYLIQLKITLGILYTDRIDWLPLTDFENEVYQAHPMLRHMDISWDYDNTIAYKEILEYVTR